MPACKPVSPAAIKLFHEGSIALAQVEAAGIRIDVPYLDATIEATGRQIKDLEARLRDTKEYGIWRREYGGDANLGAREQCSHVLFDIMGFTCHTRKKRDRDDAYDEDDEGRAPADETNLEYVGTPFALDYIQYQKLVKLKSTSLEGVRREVEGEYLHPFFNLHNVKTYRGSSDTPNFQNLPIRDKMMGELIRRAFIPRPGHRLVEFDYKAIEVRVAACYHKDPRMLDYIKDKTKDMHRDMAIQCYRLPPWGSKHWTKENEGILEDDRQQAKSLFVFAEFYGDYYVKVCKNLWEAIDRYHLKDHMGRSLHVWLKEQGIDGLGKLDPRQKPQPGTFERHIKDVEDDFWGNRFQVYDQWRKAWYKAYRKAGGFHTLTGFTVEGVHSRNEVINSPVQGSAFHCLLWSLTQIVREQMRRRMRSRVVGQIHDSIVADVHEDEFDEFVAMARHIMIEELLKAMPWIITPIEVDVAACEPGGSWFSKKKVRLAA